MDRTHSVFAKIRRIFLWLAVFGIAMGFLEAIVVVYLRQVSHPQGFEFPAGPLPPQILAVEWLREATTIVMLGAVAMIAGKNRLERFSYFLYSFGVWDISYYAGLKLLLDWPPSLLTWDVLFLIPVPWVAPVLAPIICSLTMILLAVCWIGWQERGYTVRVTAAEWGLLILGALIILGTFIWDYARLVIEGGFLSSFWTLATNENFQRLVSRYTPTSYNWCLFALGEIAALWALARIGRHAQSS